MNQVDIVASLQTSYFTSEVAPFGDSLVVIAYILGEEDGEKEAAGGETPPPSPPHCQLSPARYQTRLRHPLHCRLSPAGYQIQLQCLFLNALRGVVDGLHHITYYIEQNQAQLAVIAQEVNLKDGPAKRCRL